MAVPVHRKATRALRQTFDVVADLPEDGYRRVCAKIKNYAPIPDH
jgi:hypothetical protein